MGKLSGLSGPTGACHLQQETFTAHGPTGNLMVPEGLIVVFSLGGFVSFVFFGLDFLFAYASGTSTVEVTATPVMSARAIADAAREPLSFCSMSNNPLFVLQIALLRPVLNNLSDKKLSATAGLMTGLLQEFNALCTN